MLPVKRYFIQASNIHIGGGLKLLKQIYKVASTEFTICVDSRAGLCGENAKVINVKPSVMSRLKSEFYIYINSNSESCSLFFGNLPPVFPVRGYVVLFFQNLLLVSKENDHDLIFLQRMKIYVERIWLKMFIGNVNEIVVQNTATQKLVKSLLGGGTDVIVKPFYDSGVSAPDVNVKSEYRNIRFLYVASAEPHKNHYRLLEAWKCLAELGVNAALELTVPEDSSLYRDIILGDSRFSTLNIINHGVLSFEDVDKLYGSVDCVIYPSLVESFGLPLLEAKKSGVSIIASELDYVRDLVIPIETFDPTSHVSMCRAVLRFLGERNTIVNVISAEKFINDIFK